MAISLPDLPYAQDALEPVISAQTLSFHHGKHHAAYVNKANEMIADTPHAEKSLEELIHATAGDASQGVLFNQVAQVWNHTFYWESMKPNGGGVPTGAIAAAIDETFGSYDEFRSQFKAAAMSQFGSGWAWLVKGDSGLEIMKTGNAELPMTKGKTALLTCDVWEHAYYLDFQNRRPDYVDAFLDKLVDWERVNARLADA
ncbi:MAG: superoxide dismutase [Pseudomonadota bacterium]